MSLCVSFCTDLLADIDDCNGVNCTANSECNDLVDDFTCLCLSGYQLTPSMTCVDRDECIDGDFTCQANSKCTNTIGSYVCPCVSGFEADGDLCRDVDECTAGLSDCDIPTRARCINFDGSFTCQCINGHVGDGVLCQCKSEVTHEIMLSLLYAGMNDKQHMNIQYSH